MVAQRKPHHFGNRSQHRAPTSPGVSFFRVPSLLGCMGRMSVKPPLASTQPGFTAVSLLPLFTSVSSRRGVEGAWGKAISWITAGESQKAAMEKKRKQL